jgi:hypothetical protein
MYVNYDVMLRSLEILRILTKIKYVTVTECYIKAATACKLDCRERENDNG